MFELVCKDDLEWSTVSNTCTNTFFIRADDICFPHEEWTDFSSTILENWSTRLFQLIQNKKRQRKLFFFDGPYFLNIKINNGMQAELSFIRFENTLSETQILGYACIPFVDFVKQVLNAIKQLQLFLSDNMLASDIISKLQEYVARFEIYLASIDK